MKSAYLLGVFVCLTYSVAIADSPTSFHQVDPATVQFDVSKMEDFEQRLATDIENGRIVGAVALIARGDKVAYLKTWGHQDRELNVPMSTDTIFRIYSMTKPITTVAAMQLVEQGKLALDDPVSKYLPALGDLKVIEKSGDETKWVAPKRAPTVRDLCRHTSGLTYGVWADQEINKKYWTEPGARSLGNAANLVKKLGRYPLEYQPGTKWQYSYASDVLAEVVAVVSGERFDRYLHRQIFEPLQMNDTFFLVPKEKRARLARNYKPDGPDALKPIPTPEKESFTDPEDRNYSGGGGLASTTGDYYRFCKAILFGGELDGRRILKDQSIDQMFSKQLDESVEIDDQSVLKEGYNFGLGFAVTPNGMGWGGAAGTRFAITPNRDRIAIYMTQIAPYNDRNYGETFLSQLLEADQRDPEN